MTRETKPPKGYASDEDRWGAVFRRDPHADGKFVYSVQTTGVYCRPGCSSRRPNRENVRFYTSPQEAERAGFRPCKRCQPNGVSILDEYLGKVAAACRAIHTAEDAPSLAALARAAGLSRFHFHRIFKKITGLTPKAYALGHRAERVRQELSKHRTVTDALYRAGFNSNARFYAQASRSLGMKPKTFKSGGRGESILFAITQCSLGSILVAASEMGVCAIFLGSDPNMLRRELQTRFPKAQLAGGSQAFEKLVSKVVKLVEAPSHAVDLPLDVRGTAFQQKVWKALQEIPAGSTASYSEIAQQIGSPKAVRAVAGACASNAIAVAIPCHRVLHADGSLSGYRWGIKRKQALLDRER